MTITEPGGVFFLTLEISVSYSASDAAARAMRLEACLRGATKAPEYATQLSTIAMMTEFESISVTGELSVSLGH